MIAGCVAPPTVLSSKPLRRTLGVLVVVVLLGLLNHQELPTGRPATRSQKPTKPSNSVSRVKGPRGSPGGIFLRPTGRGKLSVRMWFPLGCDGHEGVLDEVFQLYHAHREEMGIICILGLRTDDDRRKARDMGWLGTSDRVILNGKTSFPITERNGQKRTVKLVGFEGKDYSLADFRSLLRRLLNQPNASDSATPTHSSSDPPAPDGGRDSR